MKVTIEIIGYVQTLTNGDKVVEVEMPGDSAVMGEVLVELGKRYGERYYTLVVNEQERIIHVVAMKDGKIIHYDTPLIDGDRAQLTVIMDGG